MEPSPLTEIDLIAQTADGVSVRRWFVGYACLLCAAAGVLAWLVAGAGWNGLNAEAFTRVSPAAKLVVLGVYLSLCCTFLPLPTGWIVAAAGAREAAVAGGLWPTVLLVAAAGAAGSTIANLNDYHLFTWMLRHRRIGKIRSMRGYGPAARWFEASPVLLLVIVNILPIPIDVVRVLAATCRYGRLPFAAANFAGRFIRYGVIAVITYTYDLGWLAAGALLVLAGVLAGAKAAGALLKKLRRPRGGTGAVEESGSL